ncbi:cytochrome C oxidase subunit IV family protein [Mesorhizobium sp. M1396]|uniref:cytochrome C oxidase subunit IV family protein n=1 Tax=Mesorhizobium sp. M1396 TaxID=2957095 RepID=UPI00333557B0
MSEGARKQLVRAWLMLVSLTCASVLAVRFAGNTAGLALVLCFAMFKARFVILDFMRMRQDIRMRRALIGWCMALALAAAAKAILAAAAAG